MRKKIVILLLAGLVLFKLGYPEGKKDKLPGKEKDQTLENLDLKYRDWWNQVYYISTDVERDVFLKLKNNRDREIFIRTFWQQRDPTPGTDANEFKKEIEDRFEYVKKYYSRGTSLPGWKTDMGRYYMILGKPNSIERFESKAGLYPAQVWYYHGDPTLGLPTYFNITFFRPNNTTEWKFYNPSMDGPAALLIKQAPVDETNFEGIYETIKELAPELAMPSMTMIPNEIAPGFRPPMRNNILISNIYESPKRKINASYASHFLNYKGYVTVEDSINYVDNTFLVAITRYERFGFNFVNISLQPKQISLGYDDKSSQYFFSYDVSIGLRKGDTDVYEYKKKFDFYLEANRVNALKANGIVIHDAFPVIPGDYKVSVYAMNSVGKEFTYFEKDIKVSSTGSPTLATPIIGYKSELQADNFFFPYRFDDKKLFVDTGKTLGFKERPMLFIGAYNLDQPIWEKGKVAIELRGLSERTPFKKTYNLSLNQYPYSRDMNILYRLGAEGETFNPDYYELDVKLLDGAGNVWDTRPAQFIVSPLTAVAYPMETFKKTRADNPYYFYYILAQQYEKTGKIDQAENYYAKAIENNADFKEGITEYLNILNRQKKYNQVLVEVEKLKDDERFSLDYHLVKATALYGMKDYNEALNHLLKANAVYDSDIRVLNLLGFTLLNLKEYDEALKAFNASLSLNDKQDFIKTTVEKVKKQQESEPGKSK